MACPFTNQAPVVACPAGTYAPGANASCLACQAGSYCPDSLTSLPCPVRTYSFPGASSCSPCPAGYQCNGAAAAFPQQCLAGTYSFLGNSTCEPCVEGYFCPVAGMPQGTEPDYICPPGYYCPPGAINPIACGAGTHNPLSGSISGAACIPCPAGYFCDAGTYDYTLNQCPPGYACEEGTAVNAPGAIVPVATSRCDAGTYNDLVGATDPSDCKTCPPGNYCPRGSTAPIICPAGYFCEAGTQDFCAAGGVGGCDTTPPKACLPGTFSPVRGLSDSSQCETCPAGSYCPAPSVYPTPCPPGTYSPSFGAINSGTCLLCDAGSACTLGGLLAPNSNCSAGHYCPQGTVYPSDTPCPPGKYTDSLSASMLTDCMACPKGYTCGFGTGGLANPPVPCKAGQWCAAGVSAGTNCPAGTYSNATTNTLASDCLPCTAGWSCAPGATTPTTLCPRGRYCPRGTSQGSEPLCPLGSYGPSMGNARVEQCDPCPAGSWCAAGVSSPTSCLAGRYSNATSQGTIAACKPCPAGSTCPNAAQTEPYPCGTGRYSNTSSTVTVCPTCWAGWFCPNETTSFNGMMGYPCPASAVCEAGVGAAPLTNASRLCPVGHYCSGNNAVAVACPAGTYNPSVGISTIGGCLDCPEGHWCAGGEMTPSGNCSAGYYCTGKASTPTQFACPVRTYRSALGGTSLSSCAWCPGGYICDTPGLAIPVLCPAGQYCLPNSTHGIDCPKGTYGPAMGLQAAALCSGCLPGMYCASPGLVYPSGNCTAGFYCGKGADNPTAFDQPAVGGPCTLGGYCPTGSAKATPCPVGRYGNAIGLADALQCTQCPAGSYCQGTGTNNVTGTCAPGYYCPAGSETAQAVKCTPGFFCEGGNASPAPCPAGQFQISAGAVACTLCPAGFYCDAANATNFRDCPVGSYCPEGSAADIPCPPGTIGERPLLKTRDECTPCPLSYYCTGGTNAKVLCGPGVYCPGNQTNANGVSCPVGSYCPAASSTPTPCGVGYYQPLTLQSLPGSCVLCTAGSYCSESSGSAPAGLCAAGYYCPQGSASPSGMGACPINTYCAGNNSAPISCAPGRYSNGTGASICTTCQPGYYCPGATSRTLCPGGSWCAAGAISPTVDAPRSGVCPQGTYGLPGRSAVNQCTPCPAGAYCATSGLADVTGACAPGFLCAGSAINPYGSVLATPSVRVPCPNGYYCPAGGMATSCPLGRYMAYNNTLAALGVGAGYVSNCTSCPPTMYCAKPGATAPTGLCAAGWYCGGNSSSATPSPSDPFFDASQNGQCVAGQYCPLGSSEPTPCAPGTYSSVAGASSCSNCSEGYYCPSGPIIGSVEPTPPGRLCPAGSYCPTGSADPPPKCPPGTYSGVGGLKAVSECTDCEAGLYCAGMGNIAPTGNCTAGYLCVRASSTPAPTSPTAGTTGYLCPPGTFCPSGTTYARPCTTNYYCSGGKGVEDGLCGPGAYCLSGDSDRYARACPAGSYCNGTTLGVQPCPQGTFSDLINATSIEECLPCPGGMYCNRTASVSSWAMPCPAGWYCPEGTVSPWSHQCTLGHYCPGGTSAPVPCNNGTYQDTVGSSICKTVPAGYYSYTEDVSAGISTYTLCPAGSYCPSGSNSPVAFLCPPGTYLNSTGASSISRCTKCSPGFYCDTWGATTGSDPLKPCAEGYYCGFGANTSMPTDGVTGDICPLGAYCEVGSAAPTPCPPGKQAASLGSKTEAACVPCSPGFYCASSVSGVAPCKAGWWCILAATTPTPTDNVTGIACPPGTYCPTGHQTEPLKCLPGSFNPQYSQGSCSSCPAGFVCSGLGTITPTVCPAGAYCPGNNAVATPCPPGTYSTAEGLTAASQCAPCPAGRYCDGSDPTTSTGDCNAGFLCASGAADPSPVASPCPRGYYCPAGITTPTPCPAGRYGAVVGLQNEAACTLCDAGRFCAVQALSNYSGSCAAGYYCQAGSTTPQENLCPAGSFCAGGNAAPTLCPDASYNSQQGQSSCSPCAPGFTCTNGSTTSQQALCPLGYYCALGQPPTPCSEGSYGQIPGLHSDDECAFCPAGKYCRSGQITGNCTAGYLCRSGNSVANPPGPLDVAGQRENGGECPAGFYCPEGVEDGIACPVGTSRLATRGTQKADCGPCIAGYTCLANIPVLCPQGFYCPINNTAALPCPPGTYGPAQGGFNLSSCLPCQAGYTCNKFNMSDYLLEPCAPGQFCPTGSENSYPCPGGTYRPEVGGKSPDDCHVCPAGYSCLQGSVTAKPCLPGTFCPLGSTVPTGCPPGYYCASDLSSNPIIPRICAAGFYCPANSTMMLECVAPYFCPEGSPSPSSCPKGMYNVSTNDRTSQEANCAFCPAGTYSIDPDNPVCEPCTPGYVCLQGTNTATPTNVTRDKGYMCGPGQFCPEGSTDVQYCQPGTYNPSWGGGTAAACLPCLNNSFSAVEGASTCVPCGSSAYAGLGATNCICNGTYRAYQLSEGTCKCKPGYEYYDHSHALFDGDSPFDCTPIVYSECRQRNRNSQGNCVSDEVEACERACAGSALRLANAMCDKSLLSQPDGVLDVVTQVCTCANVPILAYCDDNCKRNQSTLTLSRDLGVSIVNRGDNTATSFTADELLENAGLFAPQLACTRSSGCQMTSIVTAASGHRALMGAPPVMSLLAGLQVSTVSMCNYSTESGARSAFSTFAFEEDEMEEQEMQEEGVEREHYTLLSLLSKDTFLGSGSSLKPSGRLLRPGARLPRSTRFGAASLSSPSGRAGRSLLQSSANPYLVAPTLDYLQTLQGYYNPTLCLQEGESVFWQIDDPAHFPVYQKDNFLNSNGDFDYGVFEQLRAQLAVGAPIASFAFTFFATGTYVFADAANDEHLTIIGVLPLAQPCPAGNRVLPTSAASLKPLGVGAVLSPMTAPDLTLIWALLGAFLGLVVVLAITAKLKQRRAQRYLALAAEDDSQARSDFKQLYLEIREQKRLHRALFSKQRDHFRSECDRICAETEQVKALLATKMTDGRGFVDAAIHLLLQELTARNSYGNRQARRETDMFSQLNTLKRMLDDCNELAEQQRVLEIPTQQVQEQVDSVSTKLGDVIREAEKERLRKRHLQSNAGIIGDEIVKKLTEHAFEEEGRENGFLQKLKQFHEQATEYRNNVAELQAELDEKVKVLQERRNHAAAESATLKAQRRVSDLASGLSIDLERLLGLLPGLHEELKQSRESTVEDENEALEVLEQRKLDVEAQVQTGIFRDLEEDLAAAIKFFLLQARRELLPMQAAFDQAAMMAGGQGLTLGRAFGQAEFGTTGFGPAGGAEGATGTAGGKRTDGEEGESGMAPSDVVEATSAALSAAADEEAERARRQALEGVEDMSVDELRQLYATMRQREEMMEKLQREEEERQKRLAEELLKSSAMEANDELLLGKARDLLDTLVEEHRREEEQLHSQIKSDEEVRISAEIAALSKVEENIERKKRELAEEMARRNELAASESEKTEIAHEHQVQLKSLEESLRADKLNSQKALNKIHDETRSKLRKAKEEMRAKQRASEAAARADFDKVKDEVDRKIEEQSVKIEGVDLKAIEAALAASATAPNRKQEALQNLHLQNQQDIAKRQQAEERKLAEQNERERQKELDLLEKQMEARKEAEIAELEQRLKLERDSLGDEEQAKALMLQHQNQLRALGVQLDAEKAAQKAHLNAALAKRRKAREAKLRAEHQLETEKELFEQAQELANISKSALKKKEVEALSLLLTKENHRKAKALIEKLIRPRQHKEISMLIQDNFKETALSLQENLDKSMELAAQHREDIDRRLQAHEITQEEADREYKLVEQEVDPAAIKQSTLQYLEPQQNEKLTLQKRSHQQEVRDLMKRFYPQEDFSGAEWAMEEQTVDMAAMVRDAEARKQKAEEEMAAKVREMEVQEAEQIRQLEALKQARLQELESKMEEENARLQAEFEAQLAAKKKDFEEQQKREAERALQVEMEALEQREREAKQREEQAAKLAAELEAAAVSGEEAVAAAAAAARAKLEADAISAEKNAIAEEKKEMLAELAEVQRETQRQQEAEETRQRKKHAQKLALRAQEAKLAELAKLEEEHNKSMEQQKRNMAASAEKLKQASEEEEQRKQEVLLMAARAFIRFGRAYADHRDIGVKVAVRRIRKVYDKARAQGRIQFSLVPGPVAGTMLQVPLQPGMPIIGGGGAVAGEGGVMVPGATAGGVGAPMGMGLGIGMPFPGTGEAGQPFFNKLEKIENTLSKLLKSGHDGMFQAELLPFHAPGDDKLVCEGTRIQEVALLDLSPKKFVLYRFGLYVLELLAEAAGVAPLRLLLVKSLPAKVDAQKYLENAFRNSFHFDPLQRILFVRLERTEEVGEFTLLLVHCMAHVQAGSWSDLHPKFHECFHQALQCICSELFFARTKKGYAGFGSAGPAAAQLANKKQTQLLLQPGEAASASAASIAAAAALGDDVVPPAEGIGYKELQSLFGLAKSLEFREDVVGEFLDLHQLGSGADDLFSEAALMQRMEQYKFVSASQPLQTYLRELEKQALASKQEANLQHRVNQQRDKLMPKLGTVGDKDPAAAAGAVGKGGRRGSASAIAAPVSAKEAAQQKRDQLRQSTERLLEESDSLHSQLLGVIGAMAPVSESLLALTELISKLQAARVPADAPQLVEAHSERKKVQARLRRLHIQKDALNQRIEHVEEKYKQKMAELAK